MQTSALALVFKAENGFAESLLPENIRLLVWLYVLKNAINEPGP